MPAIAILLLLVIPGSEATGRGRRKCIVPRRGPYSGLCVDIGLVDRFETETCAQEGGVCKWMGQRCPCYVHSANIIHH